MSAAATGSQRIFVGRPIMPFASGKNVAQSSRSPVRPPPHLLTEHDACTSGLHVSSSAAAVVTTVNTSSCSRVSCHVRLLWTALSLMVTAGCTYSFTQPAWYINGRSRDGLGLYNYCVRDDARPSTANRLALAANR